MKTFLLMKRLLWILFAFLLLGLLSFFTWMPAVADRLFNRVAESGPYPASPAAQALHERLFVADLHADQLLWGRDPLARADYGHVDVPRLREGNVGLQVFSVVTKSPWGQNYEQNEGDSDRITLLVAAQRWPVAAWTSLKERALYQARRLREAAARSEEGLVLIRSAGDLAQFLERRAAEPDLVAGLLAIEGLHALEGELANVDAFYEAGFRMMAPTHMFDNAVAGSAHGVAQGGLTELGRQVIRRMEELGIVVDLAHVSPRAIDEVLEMATRPVVVSHTGVQGTCPGPRNLSDRQIREIAATGGVIGIGFWEGAVCGAAPADIARAVRHVVDLVGADHVALGSDFDGTVRTPFDASGLVQVTEALIEAGFSEAEIRKIMGENLLRVLRQTLR